MSKYAAKATQAVLDYFKETLNNRLPTVANAMGVNLPDIPQFLKGEWWEHTQANYAFVFPDRVSPHRRGNGQGSGSYDTQVNFAIRHKTSADIESGLDVVMGYATAITELLDARDLGALTVVGDPTLGGRVSVCVLESIEFGSMPSGDKSATAYGLIATMLVRVHEAQP